MTKKMKREQKPTAVGDDVAEAMEVRLAYKNLIDSFNAEQSELEVRIQASEETDDPQKPPPPQ